jgi:hypothetical protein
MKPNDSNTLYALHTNFNGSIEKISDHAGNIGKATPLLFLFLFLFSTHFDRQVFK